MYAEYMIRQYQSFLSKLVHKVEIQLKELQKNLRCFRSQLTTEYPPELPRVPGLTESTA